MKIELLLEAYERIPIILAVPVVSVQNNSFFGEENFFVLAKTKQISSFTIENDNIEQKERPGKDAGIEMEQILRGDERSLALAFIGAGRLFAE